MKMIKDDKLDNESNDSGTSIDSGVITDENLMSEKNQCNIDITTSIGYSNNTSNTDNVIDLDKILNIAKNVSPQIKGSAKNATPSNKSSSPTFSIRSTNISITSIHSDAVSSVIESDCDDFDDANSNYVIKKLGYQTSCEPGKGAVDIPNIGSGDGVVLLQQRVDGEQIGAMALASTSSSPPQVGNLAFTNSTDITIGQKNYYQGPVTIQQFLIESRKREEENAGGSDNPAFNGDTVTEGRDNINNRDSSKNDLPSKPYKFIFNHKAVIITTVIVVLIIILGVILKTTSSMLQHKRLDNIGGGRILRIIPRGNWVATPANAPIDKLNLPVSRVIIAHTATSDCSYQAACVYLVKIMQSFQMNSLGFFDIGYNFLIGGDGAVYEGRGWDLEGYHTKSYNKDSICIAFIGTFTKTAPAENQLNAAKLIIEEGISSKKIREDYFLYGALQLKRTESPGAALYEVIKNWPHWSAKIY